MKHKENAHVDGVGILEAKPLAVELANGFFVYLSQNRTLSQLIEPCLSCGRRLRLTAATIRVHGICGHVAVCKVCRDCVVERGLIG
jgi:hypothetical protein